MNATGTENVAQKVETLRKMSRTYKKNDCGRETCLDKTWNRGMGRQCFIEVRPDDGLVLYNGNLANKRDLQRIRQVFPEFEIVKVDVPYHSTSDLYALYRKALNIQSL